MTDKVLYTFGYGGEIKAAKVVKETAKLIYVDDGCWANRRLYKSELDNVHDGGWFTSLDLVQKRLDIKRKNVIASSEFRMAEIEKYQASLIELQT